MVISWRSKSGGKTLDLREWRLLASTGQEQKFEGGFHSLGISSNGENG
jgi:hypothetical protein